LREVLLRRLANLDPETDSRSAPDPALACLLHYYRLQHFTPKPADCGRQRLSLTHVKIAITGSSGLIGTALRASLAADGHEVVRLVRRPARAGDEVEWDPAGGHLETSALDGVTAAVNLAGVGFGDKRWSDRYKTEILESRVAPTDLLSRTLAQLDSPPAVLVSASAIGVYPAGDEVMTEQSAAGDEYQSSVCVDWEAATKPAEQAGIRVAHIRSGLVMAAHGGILKRTLLPFKFGVGGRIGSGRQYWSWIDLEDEVAAIRFLLDSDLSGPVNLTAPNPLPFGEVAKILGKVLHRPSFMVTPTFALKALLGAERTEALLLSGRRVVPDKLMKAGFEFRFPDFEASIRHQLKR